ncbi:MAG: hypothetical protein L3J39_06500 [Verrucomicrobiales bacterium]|nr:hypothetical protein [Verrucomicrobiales bacterium]
MLTSCTVDPDMLSTPMYNGSSYGNQSGYHSNYNSGYSPYVAPPRGANSAQSRDHAYQVGFRVGQDDFNQNMDKHYPRHAQLYTSNTQSAFKQGYVSGYDRARSNSRGRQNGSRYNVHNNPVRSDNYSTGYYPYAPVPNRGSSSQRNSHAYDVGYRVGQDDFNHKKPKHYPGHSGLYDNNTRQAFKNGYVKGYDNARKGSR